MSSENGHDVAVTGATGFVGRALCSALESRGHSVLRFSRRGDTQAQPTGDIDSNTNWRARLSGVDSVVHLAARVHVLQDNVGDPLGAYMRTNYDATVRLAKDAAAVGVRRLVFVSSIKVNGENTRAGGVYHAYDVPAPEGGYAQSKHAAEQALAEISAESGLEVVVIRPPLIYGPGVKANFARLMRWVEKGIPLPLGAIDNRRSMLALPNLVDLIIHCLYIQSAAGHTFLASDGQDVSTPELIRMMAAALGRPARLWSVPPGVLQWTARAAGRSEEIERLIGSLQVDSQPTRDLLDWKPPVSVMQGIRQTADARR